MKPTHPIYYEIRVAGQLPVHWRGWFNDLEVSTENDQTRLSGPVDDQAALYGLLKKVRDLGLTLISVNLISNPLSKE